MIIYVLQCVALCSIVLQCVAVCCSMLQCVAVCHSVSQFVAAYCTRSEKTDEAHDSERARKLQHIVAHCNTLQHNRNTTATQLTQQWKRTEEAHYLMVSHAHQPQHIAAHCNTLQHTVTHCNNMLQHHCNRRVSLSLSLSLS